MAHVFEENQHGRYDMNIRFVFSAKREWLHELRDVQIKQCANLPLFGYENINYAYIPLDGAGMLLGCKWLFSLFLAGMPWGCKCFFC